MRKNLDQPTNTRFENGGSKIWACLLPWLGFVLVSIGCQKEDKNLSETLSPPARSKVGSSEDPKANSASGEKLSSPVVAVATGSDFQWNFTYPGADANLGTEDDIEQSKTLYLPPNTDVELQLKSADYIYTMTLPNEDSENKPKEIAVPDLTFTLRFHTPTTAQWDLMVDPMCGFRPYHDDQMGEIIIADRSDFLHRFGASKAQSDPTGQKDR